MIAPGACVQLHDHAVVARHQSHLSQHLGANSSASPRSARRAGCGPAGLRLDFRKIGRARSRMAVVARARPVSAEEGAARGDRSEIAAPLAGVLAGQLAKPPQIDGKILAVRVDDVIGRKVVITRPASPTPGSRRDA